MKQFGLFFKKFNKWQQGNFTKTSISAFDELKAKHLLKEASKKITKLSDSTYKEEGSKEKNSYTIDLNLASCSCTRIGDKGSCKHLVAYTFLADTPVLNLKLNKNRKADLFRN